MSERDRGRFPPWAERERVGDLDWIKENLCVFWSVAQNGYEGSGRGAIVADTTQRAPEGGHPLCFFAQTMVEQSGDEDTLRMVREYDPAREMVAVFLKTDDCISVYRIGMSYWFTASIGL